MYLQSKIKADVEAVGLSLLLTSSKLLTEYLEEQVCNFQSKSLLIAFINMEDMETAVTGDGWLIPLITSKELQNEKVWTQILSILTHPILTGTELKEDVWQLILPLNQEESDLLVNFQEPLVQFSQVF